MNFYPYSYPIIMTDDLFVLYGGHTGTTTSAQRSVAYTLAEQAASADLGTLLLPTIVTGTYNFHELKPFIILDHAYVNNVPLVRFFDVDENNYHTISGTANVYASLRDDEYGTVDLDLFFRRCCSSLSLPYKVQIVYQAGLPTGTANHPDILLALTTYSDIILNEIIGYGNEAPGDIGIQSFRNQQYSEERIGLIRTSFGSSPKANFAHRLLTKKRKLRYVGI